MVLGPILCRYPQLPWVQESRSHVIPRKQCSITVYHLLWLSIFFFQLSSTMFPALWYRYFGFDLMTVLLMTFSDSSTNLWAQKSCRKHVISTSYPSSETTVVAPALVHEFHSLELLTGFAPCHTCICSIGAGLVLTWAWQFLGYINIQILEVLGLRS